MVHNLMAALFSGDRQPRLRIDRDRIPVPGGSSPRTEIITVMNEGGGILKGTIITDVPWITIPNLKLETPFILPLRIEITPEKIPPGARMKGTVTIVTNGGSAQIVVEYIPHPEPKPILALDERQLQFCNLRKGEDVTADLIVRNIGTGVLSGTAESESDWIEVKNRTIWTRNMQAIPVVIHTAATPGVRQPVGRIRIRSSGGSQEITISIHFRSGAGPKLRLDPHRIRCVWDKRGIIEETLTIHNDGEGILRGTIPSPIPWLKIIPSIFPVEKSARIRISIDTRKLPAEGTLTIPVSIITNAGRDILTVEVIAGKRAPVATPPRRARTPSRTIYRSRLIAYDHTGKIYTLTSSGHSGGEGEIYHLASDGERCAKIFHPHRRTTETEEKLRVMIRNPPSGDLIHTLTWPEVLLYDLPGGDRVIGYLMRRIPDTTFRSAHLWYDEPEAGDRKGIIWRIIPALALARVVSGIHRSGHSIGDLRENNLLVSNSGDLILIDTDSFQIRDPGSGRVFWSRVGTGEYLPPEHLDGSFAHDGCDRRTGDHFALAVLIFRFLMDGVHPFQAKGPLVRDAPATTDKILLGHFAFESRIAGISPPDYAPSYSIVPVPVKTLFREAFVTGHTNPRSRPDAERWVQVLSTLIPKNQIQKTRKAAPLVTPSPENKKTRTPIITDGNRKEILPGRRLYQVPGGTLYATGEKGTLIFLSDTPASIPIYPDTLPTYQIPPSIILPRHPVLHDETTHIGWLISGLDYDQYLPWHMNSDPESRKSSGRETFSFRHRIACSRNLMAALISIHRLNLPLPYISCRSVYVGPDTSVRVLCIPGIRLDEPEKKADRPHDSPIILVFRMLMDGYHPYHAIGRRVSGFRSPEKRMKAGMYPWSGIHPDLTPPHFAPPINILPEEIQDLFENEFGEKERRDQGDQIEDYSRWFEVLDRVLRSMICCLTDSDHWYIPGLGGCPWCQHTRIKEVSVVQAGIRYPPAPEQILRLLSSLRIVGYLMIPGRYRRHEIVSRRIPCRWGVIPLPPERVHRLLLSPVLVVYLPLEENRPILLIPRKRSWISCITPVSVTSLSNVPGEESDAEDLNLLYLDGRFQTYSGPGISLIDEMILTSTMDRLRGEGIGMPKCQRGNRSRQPSLRRRPIQIMLYPIDLPWPTGEIQSPLKREAENTALKKRTNKKGQGKGIRGRLQTFLRDFIGEET
ncbi:MAG: hypothetical protein V1862_11020 [Methanobacteriota archaeon]